MFWYLPPSCFGISYNLANSDLYKTLIVKNSFKLSSFYTFLVKNSCYYVNELLTNLVIIFTWIRTEYITLLKNILLRFKRSIVITYIYRYLFLLRNQNIVRWSWVTFWMIWKKNCYIEKVIRNEKIWSKRNFTNVCKFYTFFVLECGDNLHYLRFI